MIYICETYYHFLISLLKIDRNISNTIVVNDDLIFPDNTLEMLQENLNVELLCINNRVDFLKFLKSISLSEIDNIFIFNDCTYKGDLLRKNKIYYTLIEDSYNYFQYNTQFSTMPLRQKIPMKLCSTYSCLGFSKYTKIIEVNDINRVVNDKRILKMVEVPRKKLFRNIGEELKELILKIFSVELIPSEIAKKSVLVLTQPIIQDNFDKQIKNAQEQVLFYKSIVDMYIGEYDIYFKVHPRDDLDYSMLKSEGVFILEKNVPMELYEFVGDYEFDIGITHSSTALDYLSCVKEKIFLKDLKAK